MDRTSLRLVFLGNPEFARHHLELLLTEGFNVVGVISAPDKPAGRGMNLRSTPVTQFARKMGITVLQPRNLKSEEFQAELKALKADIQVVIAFRMLPEAVWNMPPMGTINLHASLLPNYRGAAPINWAIINGEEETGVTSFKLKHVIDTGDILLQESCEIATNDTAGSLHDKLMHLGAPLMVRTLDGLLDGSLEEQAQESTAELKSAPKIFPEDCLLDFNADVGTIHNFIRGLSPYPVARMKLDDKILKVFQAHIKYAEPKGPSGQMESDGKHYLRINCKDGYLYLDQVQLEGKRKMNISDFLRGYRISD